MHVVSISIFLNVYYNTIIITNKLIKIINLNENCQLFCKQMEYGIQNSEILKSKQNQDLKFP